MSADWKEPLFEVLRPDGSPDHYVLLSKVRLDEGEADIGNGIPAPVNGVKWYEGRFYEGHMVLGGIYVA